MTKLWSLRPYQRGDEMMAFRAADEAEVQAASGVSCRDCVLLAAAFGGPIVTAVDPSGRPVAIAGVTPVDAVAGCVWALAAPGLAAYSRSVLLTVPPVLNRWNEQWPLLFNYVDVRNAVSIRWLQRLGCQFIRRHERFGVAGIPFYEFVRTAPCALH